MEKQASRIKLLLVINMLIFGIFIPISQVSTKGIVESSVHQITDLHTYVLTDFADFEHVVNHTYMYSSNNISHIEFDYLGETSDAAIYEKYLYTLPLNCSDFYIRLKMNYTASDISDIFISYAKVYGEDYAITETKIYDGWVGSQAKHYLQAWPNGVSDSYEDGVNSAGLSGTVTYEMSRFSGIVATKIMNEDSSVVFLEHQWTSGVSTLTYGFAVFHRSGLLGGDTHATFYDLYANFTTTEYTPLPTPTPDPTETPTDTPTETPTSTPSFPSLTIGISSGLIVTSAVCIIGVLLYLKKRKS